MLPANELSRIQSDLLATLPDVCNVLTMTPTSDGMGGWSEAWGTTGAFIPCRVDFQRGNEAVTAEELTSYRHALLTLPAGTPLNFKNRVQHNGNTYEVHAVNLGSWLGVVRADIEKVGA